MRTLRREVVARRSEVVARQGEGRAQAGRVRAREAGASARAALAGAKIVTWQSAVKKGTTAFFPMAALKLNLSPLTRIFHGGRKKVAKFCG